ncbi:MAG: hypothetical protein WCJ35_08625 [Planctomycetota bacterium]
MNSIPPHIQRIGSSAKRFGVLLIGIILGQAVLYGPSLLSYKVLLPIDYLALKGIYLPQDSRTAAIGLHNFVLSDLVLNGEPGRQVMAQELRAGRWPLWVPYQYGGAPFTWPKYSPFWLLSCIVASPIILAWTQVAIALVASIGMYAFCRQSLQTGFWPAAIMAWCFPLTGFFIFWQGYSLPMAIAWMPWLILAVERTVRGNSVWGGPALVLATFLTLVSGQLDVAGQVLLVSGIYAIWCYFNEYGKKWLQPKAIRCLVRVVLGWGLGIAMAGAQYIPLLEYTATGSRIVERSQGEEERPPVGLAALPQTVLPDMYGSTQAGSFPMFPERQGNQLESSAAAYAGLLATLLLAPLAWCNRRHRSFNLFAIALIVLGLSWSLNIPGFVQLLRMPGLKMMSHNRFVFAASFAVIALAAIGLETLANGELRRRAWFWGPALLLLGLCGWCFFRVISPPEPLATLLANAVVHGKAVAGISDIVQVRQVQANFCRNYLVAAILSALAFAGWLVLWFRTSRTRWFMPVFGGLLLVDLLWFGYGRSAQCDPALYYPRIPVLEQIAQSTPGRVIGVNCLPATLSQSHGLCDIRGYDGVDPMRWLDLMKIAAVPESLAIPYARTQWMVPITRVLPGNDLRVHPILDMLGVRYLIFRGSPPPQSGLTPDLASDDYWVMINRHALPRVFVPRHVETINDNQERLRRLASTEFDPNELAFVEVPITLPGECLGQAKIVDEVPTRVNVAIDMQTPGLMVLADRWDVGWHAYLDGKPLPILQTNHAIRGVVVPAGKATLEFRYEPASLTWGLRLSGLALLASVGWLGVGRRSRGQVSPSEPDPKLPRKEPEPELSPQKHSNRRSHKRRMN